MRQELDDLNNSLGKVRTYVGSDGKLHFVDASGADTVLPFKRSLNVVEVPLSSLSLYHATFAAEIGSVYFIAGNALDNSAITGSSGGNVLFDKRSIIGAGGWYSSLMYRVILATNTAITVNFSTVDGVIVCKVI